MMDCFDRLFRDPQPYEEMPPPSNDTSVHPHLFCPVYGPQEATVNLLPPHLWNFDILAKDLEEGDVPVFDTKCAIYTACKLGSPRKGCKQAKGSDGIYAIPMSHHGVIERTRAQMSNCCYPINYSLIPRNFGYLRVFANAGHDVFGLVGATIDFENREVDIGYSAYAISDDPSKVVIEYLDYELCIVIRSPDFSPLGDRDENGEFLSEVVVLQFSDCISYRTVSLMLKSETVSNYRKVIDQAKASHYCQIEKPSPIRLFGTMYETPCQIPCSPNSQDSSKSTTYTGAANEDLGLYFVDF